MPCVVDPKSLISYVLGLESLRSFPPDANDIRLGMLVTGVALILLGYRTLTNGRAPPGESGKELDNDDDATANKAPLHVAVLPKFVGLGPHMDGGWVPPKTQCAMRIIIAAYTFGTAMFAWSRAIWDTSKMLLILAAAHNMAEWMLICYLYLPDEVMYRTIYGVKCPYYFTAQRGTMLAFIGIWFVITVTVSLPFIPAVLFEQTAGIGCDYTLLFTFASRYFSPNKKYWDELPHMKYLWGLGLMSAFVHFGQIWPLVIGTFGITGMWGRVIEWTLIFSAAITFFFYSQFAITWERLHVSRVLKGERDGQFPAASLVEQRPAMKRTLLLGFICGISTIFGPGLIFGFCDPSHGGLIDATGTVTGYTRITAKPGQGQALKQALEKMVPLVLNENGAISYDLFTTTTEDNLLIIEKWQSIPALQTHIDRSPAVNGIYRTPYVKNMMQSQELKGPWSQVDPSKPYVESHVALNFDVANSIKDVWKVLDDWGDCSWVQGCTSADVKGTKRTLTMSSGLKLEVLRVPTTEDYSLVYEALGLPMFKHYTGTIRLTSTGPSSTSVSYNSDFITADGVNMEEATAFVIRDFEKSRIPYLQKLFAKA